MKRLPPDYLERVLRIHGDEFPNSTPALRGHIAALEAELADVKEVLRDMPQGMHGACLGRVWMRDEDDDEKLEVEGWFKRREKARRESGGQGQRTGGSSSCQQAGSSSLPCRAPGLGGGGPCMGSRACPGWEEKTVEGEVSVLAVVGVWAMCRRTGAVPHVCHVKELFEPESPTERGE